MKLIEALATIRESSRSRADPWNLGLVCGFTPLHLGTFLAAHLQGFVPDKRVEVRSGLFGDFLGNLDLLRKPGIHGAAIVLEWPDLDPRLGIRRLGGWAPADLHDILSGVRSSSSEIVRKLTELAGSFPIGVSLPTLAVAPVSFTPGWQASRFALDLRESIASLSLLIAEMPNVRIVNTERLDWLSPLALRFDPASEVNNGFPYTISHASALAQVLALLIQMPFPKKGLITDLDDTLWSGILGEVGTTGISWSHDRRSHMQGLYQQLLHALAQQGVLIGVASKNDPRLVEEAFRREDLILPRDRIFPLEAGWGQKSEMVSRILKTWNVGSDSVVFIDDSPMELAEVGSVFTDMECLQFPSQDYAAIYSLLQRLRDLFGKSALSEEDVIRLESIRSASAIRQDLEASKDGRERFLAQAAAELILSFEKDPLSARPLELINKTNQFNLNGRRFSEADWKAFLDREDSIVLVVSYEDKYGPLGKIAVLGGYLSGKTLQMEIWVMSCRAFSRRIEHMCLKQLFEVLSLDEIVFTYAPTARNGPVQDLLGLELEILHGAGARLSRESFRAKCPPLYHHIRELIRA